jgi:hypothetical protein
MIKDKKFALLLTAVLPVMAICFFWFLSSAPPLFAATRTVCSTGCDHTTIQSAVTAANPNDIIDVGAGIFNETISINKSLTFQGVGAKDTYVDGGDSGPVFTISNNVTVLISDMTIRNGATTGNGGGILHNANTLTVENVTFNSNDADGNGGALYNNGGTMTLIDISISSSNAIDGAGIYNHDGGTVEIVDSTVDSNTATGDGGGIWNNGTLTVTNTIFSDNTAVNGGGIANVETGHLTTGDGSRFSRNEATMEGGALYNGSGSNADLNDNNMPINTAVNGGGIANHGSLTLNQLDISDNNRDVPGLLGGGLYNTGSAVVLNSTMARNEADNGAGFYNSGTVTMTNSTISRNLPGGGLQNIGAIVINNVTLNLNTGGAVNNPSGSVTIMNTILAGSVNAGNCSGGGLFTSGGYNLSSDESCAFLSETGDLTGLDARLNGLQPEENSTPTHSLKLDSPALDAGNPASPGSGGNACAATDQRGMARPQARRCDIGAYEAIVFWNFIPTALK